MDKDKYGVKKGKGTSPLGSSSLEARGRVQKKKRDQPWLIFAEVKQKLRAGWSWRLS